MTKNYDFLLINCKSWQPLICYSLFFLYLCSVWPEFCLFDLLYASERTATPWLTARLRIGVTLMYLLKKPNVDGRRARVSNNWPFRRRKAQFWCTQRCLKCIQPSVTVRASLPFWQEFRVFTFLHWEDERCSYFGFISATLAWTEMSTCP